MEIHKSQQDNIQYHAAIRRQVDRENLEIRVTALPSREQFPFEINEQLIVEGCSK